MTDLKMSDLNERIARAKGWTRAREPNWSGNIADAWELMKEMRADLMEFAITPHYERHGGWCFEFLDGGRYESGTAPEAICLAWLAIHEK